MSESEQRDEGGILPWPKDEKDPQPGELDPQQYLAAVKAHELFVGMANRKEKPAPRESELDCFLPRLDAHRGNHTILIDGTRGSGKTAVMLRLLQDWSDKLRRLDVPETPLDKLPLKLEAGVQLVPVGLLDLEAVPQTANLATRIAGMFERVVSAMERRGTRSEGTSPAPTWALLQDDTLKSREKWQSFVGAAALEWDRSLERRRASIDPEAYAVEVEQAERKGLQARECFRAFIDALVKDWTGWQPQGKRPFFIVPIDDADLNPGRVVELIGLLRTLWHPRVGYLLTGDSGLFMRVLTTHFRSQIDMPALGGPTTLGAIRIQLMPDDARQAERLARDLYQKAMPLAQRLKLEPLSAMQRLEFIRDALPFAHMANTNGETLAQYIEADNFSPLALPDRWRRLIDLRNQLLSKKYGGLLGAERFAATLWEQALRESSLNVSTLSGLGDMVYVDERRKMLRFHPSSMIRGGYMPVRQEVNVCAIGEVWIYSGFALEGSFGQEPNQQNSPDGAIIAAWFLMSNLTRHQAEGLRPSAEKAYEFILVEVHFHTKNPALSKDYLFDNSAPKFRWPVPAWKQQLEKQRFYKKWDEQGPLALANVGDVASKFIAIVLEVSDQAILGDLSWQELAQKIVSVSADTQVPIGQWAIEHAGLLAAPESGLSDVDANKWLNCLREEAQKSGKWSAFCLVLRSARRERVKFALDEAREIKSRLILTVEQHEKSIEAVLEEVDSRASGHMWRSVVEAVTP